MLPFASIVTAASNNGEGDAAPLNTSHVEVPAAINCTWVIFNWYSPGTWTNEVISIAVDQTTGPIQMLVTDAFVAGDYFEVYEVDGVQLTTSRLIGVTPYVPPNVNMQIWNDPDAAVMNSSYSHANFELPQLSPGKHYFAFKQVAVWYYPAGSAYVKFCARPVGGVILSNSDTMGITGSLGVAIILIGIVSVMIVRRRRID